MYIERNNKIEAMQWKELINIHIILKIAKNDNK